MTDGGRRAVFLDRDGTIIEEVGYLNHISRLNVLPRSAEAIRRINESGMLAIVVTNQSGVARKIFDLALLEKVHGRIAALLAESGARIDAFYYCPHLPEGADPRYRRDCDCRKPKPGLFYAASRDHGVDLTRSYHVGDTMKDMEAARNAGATGVLVLTGYGRGEADFRLPGHPVRPAQVAEDLLGAVEWILGREAAAVPARGPAR